MGDASRGQLDIAVIGAGIGGLASAWLLGQRHRVVLYEHEGRLGGHSHTVEVAFGGQSVPVDTGFIVYNEATYPNLTALFRHLAVPTQASDMSFAVSAAGGRIEYSGEGIGGLLARPANAVSPRFWSMLIDLVRFYRSAPRLLDEPGDERLTLGSYLDAGRYGRAFREDHLLPMAGAIWSSAPEAMLQYPARAFVRFFVNHQLFNLGGRPLWRTVTGGSREYVRRLAHEYSGEVRRATPVKAVTRGDNRVTLRDARGGETTFDHVVIATHADQALAILTDADGDECELLGAIRYTANRTVLHSDVRLMPRRRAAWASWNYVADCTHSPGGRATVTYWMNRLQGLDTPAPLLVTLNPQMAPDAASVHWQGTYEHPVLDARAMAAQRRLWSLQGRRRTWLCGAYFGAGFHEDALQAGLAVAEQLGGVARPWTLASHSGRIHVFDAAPPAALEPEAA
ncbi:MAG: FAD-dependent oxidoreductase [Hyphomicrobiaceae bacterium]|nr:FAD-dependent oxidoreductase [Hyphomicrobiaceae bacterium]